MDSTIGSSYHSGSVWRTLGVYTNLGEGVGTNIPLLEGMETFKEIFPSRVPYYPIQGKCLVTESSEITYRIEVGTNQN